MDKKLAREMGLKRRSALSQSEWDHWNSLRNQQVIERIAPFQTIGCYVSCWKEADTRWILSWCFQHQKTVAVPQTVGSTLVFRTIQSLEELKPSFMGIPEPHNQPEIAIEAIDIHLIPLAAFDRSLNRCGYGKGYYDSVLFRARNKIGLAFPCQQVEEIVVDPWDVPLDEILTGEK